MNRVSCYVLVLVQDWFRIYTEVVLDDLPYDLCLSILLLLLSISLRVNTFYFRGRSCTIFVSISWLYSSSTPSPEPRSSFPAPIHEQISTKATYPTLTSPFPGIYGQKVYPSYGGPGGSDAGLHVSAGSPSSATPVGRLPG